MRLRFLPWQTAPIFISYYVFVYISNVWNVNSLISGVKNEVKMTVAAAATAGCFHFVLLVCGGGGGLFATTTFSLRVAEA